MKKIYQKLALTGVLAALLLSAGCGGAKETSADETAGNVPAVAEQKTDSKADMELSETLDHQKPGLRHWKQIPKHRHRVILLPMISDVR